MVFVSVDHCSLEVRPHFRLPPIQTVSTIATGRAKYDTDQRRPRDYTEADIETEGFEPA